MDEKNNSLQDEILKKMLNNLKDQMTLASDYLHHLISDPRHFNISKYNARPTFSQRILLQFYKAINTLSFGKLFSNETIIQCFKPGEVIFEKGDAFQYVYIIIFGTVKLWFDEDFQKMHAVNVSGPALFGELSLLQHQPRAATATTETAVAAICIPQDDFLDALEKFPSLKGLTVDLKNYYNMPKGDTITYKMGKKIEGQQSIITHYRLKNGRVAEGVKIVDQDSFSLLIQGVIPDAKVKYSKGGIQRSLYFRKNLLVGIESNGRWEELNILCTMLLEELSATSSISKSNFSMHGQAFATSADIVYPQKDLVCVCMRTSFEKIQNVIRLGANNLADIAAKTGAGTICGSCKPIIEDILGTSKWLFAKLQLIKEFSDDRYLFAITPIYHHNFPHFKPGNSTNIRVLIDNQWVDRSYTPIKSEDDETKYEILVGKRLEGRFSQWVVDNKTFTPLIKISPPFGNFYIDVTSHEDMFGFAEEVGIAPFISYLRHLSDKEIKHKITIFYFVQDKNNITLPEDITNLVQRHNNIAIEILIGDEHLSSPNKITNRIKEHSAVRSYICGGTRFITLMTTVLEKNHFDNRKIFHKEFFHDQEF